MEIRNQTDNWKCLCYLKLKLVQLEKVVQACLMEIVNVSWQAEICQPSESKYKMSRVKW